MDIVINPRSEVPIYEQLCRRIASQILNGALAPDECLPSIRSVARELGISIITVKNAYEQLERDGYIYTLAGKGCFVRPQQPDCLENKKLSLAEEKLRRAIEDCAALGLSAEQTAELFFQLTKASR